MIVMKANKMRALSVALATALSFGAGSLQAQPLEEDESVPIDDPLAEEGEEPAEPPPPPPPPEPVEVEDTRTDHEKVVGKMGLSWFGISNVPIATAVGGGTEEDPTLTPGPPSSVAAPALGVRYWFSERAGLDVGAGLSVSSGSVRTTVSAADKQTITAFLVHAGVPISLYSAKHISLQIAPEMNFGYARAEVEPSVQVTPPPPVELSGMRFDVGARAGAELHWGFIGIPELSLEGSVGLFFTYQGTTAAVDEVSASENDLFFGTAEYQSPWDIFTQHVRARYYF